MANLDIGSESQNKANRLEAIEAIKEFKKKVCCMNSKKFTVIIKGKKTIIEKYFD